jgi:hypothetical protein
VQIEQACRVVQGAVSSEAAPLFLSVGLPSAGVAASIYRHARENPGIQLILILV